MRFHLGCHEFVPALGAGALPRVLAVLSGPVLVCLAACSSTADLTAPTLVDTAGSTATLNSSPVGMVPGAMAPGTMSLSSAALQVREIAARYGDRDYLMLDKADGAIIVFEHGTPTFRGAALTGENPVDSI